MEIKTINEDKKYIFLIKQKLYIIYIFLTMFYNIAINMLIKPNVALYISVKINLIKISVFLLHNNLLTKILNNHFDAHNLS